MENEVIDNIQKFKSHDYLNLEIEFHLDWASSKNNNESSLSEFNQDALESRKPTKYRSRSQKNSRPNPLKMFLSNSLNRVKYEYIREQILRLLKKAIRSVLHKNNIDFIFFTKSSRFIESLEFYKRFINFVLINREDLHEISRTDNGPDTDGKCKRKLSSLSDSNKKRYKSWNHEFCREFLSMPKVLDAYDLFVSLLFEKIDCKLLSTVLKLFPRDDKKYRTTVHGMKCEECWMMLKDFYKNEINYHFRP